MVVANVCQPILTHLTWHVNDLIISKCICYRYAAQTLRRVRVCPHSADIRYCFITGSNWISKKRGVIPVTLVIFYRDILGPGILVSCLYNYFLIQDTVQPSV